MDLPNYICGGIVYAYSKGYIGLPVEAPAIPQNIEIEKTPLLRKTTFHVSLLCVKELLLRFPEAEQTILNAFCTFVADNPITFRGYTGEFRFAQYDDRRSLVALCKVENLAQFSRYLGKELQTAIPEQPAHVTLYTHTPDVGIGLNSREELERRSRPVEIPAHIKEALQAM